MLQQRSLQEIWLTTATRRASYSPISSHVFPWSYQIGNALKNRNASGDTAPVNFGPFEAAYQALSDKLRPQVFSLGFLR